MSQDLGEGQRVSETETEKLMREKIDKREEERNKKDAEVLIQTNVNSFAGISF